MEIQLMVGSISKHWKSPSSIKHIDYVCAYLCVNVICTGR